MNQNLISLVILKNPIQKLTVLIGLLIISNPLIAQNTNDSLKTLLNEHIKKDTIRANILFSLANWYKDIDINRTIKYVDEMQSISDSTNYEHGLAKSFYLRAIIALRQSDFEQCEKFLNIAITKSNKLGMLNLEAECTRYLGIASFYKGDTNGAESFFKKVCKWM